MEEKLLHAEEPQGGKNSPFRTKRNSNNLFSAKSFADFDASRLKGKNTFGSGEKLKSKKIIDQLFNRGKSACQSAAQARSVSKNGFTLVYLIQPLNTFYPAQAGFTVPKKFFKHAVDRNRIKRLMREAYRLNKIHLYEKLAARKQQLAMMFVYKGKELPEYEITLEAILNCMNRIFKT